MVSYTHKHVHLSDLESLHSSKIFSPPVGAHAVPDRLQHDRARGKIKHYNHDKWKEHALPFMCLGKVAVQVVKITCKAHAIEDSGVEHGRHGTRIQRLLVERPHERVVREIQRGRHH